MITVQAGTKTLVVVLCDGLQNSVFHSQLYEPLRKMLLEGHEKRIILVSYEKTKPDISLISQLIRNAPGLEIKVVRKRFPFLGKISLTFAVWNLSILLAELKEYNLKARGPLAGWICLKSSYLCFKKPSSLVIQARGLLAAEYAYSNQQYTGIKNTLHALRTKLFFNLERTVYRAQKEYITIECVSPALREYVVRTYGAHEKNLSIAHYDIPEHFSASQISLWRTETRTLLGISEDAYVYCYNGSAKSWQCPHETIATFIEFKQKNPHAFLLILSQDKEFFMQALMRQNLPHNAWTVVSVPHKDIYKVLAAADAGFLLRDVHIINWVSRPTKALEYQAVGIPVLHNGTVAWVNSLVNAQRIER